MQQICTKLNLNTPVFALILIQCVCASKSIAKHPGFCVDFDTMCLRVNRVVTKYQMSGHKSSLKPETFMTANVISLQL